MVRSWGHCWYCGTHLTATLNNLGTGQREHQLPRSRGGKGGLNLVLSCSDCNLQKGNLNLAEYRRTTCPLPRAAGGNPAWHGVFFGEALLHLLLYRLRSGPTGQELPFTGFPSEARQVLEGFWCLNEETLRKQLAQHRVFRELHGMSEVSAQRPQVLERPSNQATLVSIELMRT